MANNRNLRDTDLFYIARFEPDSGVPTGTLYQVTWEQIRRRVIRATDMLLVQRDLELYHVTIGEYWSGEKEIDKDRDFFLCERVDRNQFLFENEGLHYVQFEIPNSILFSIVEAGNVNPYNAAYQAKITAYNVGGGVSRLHFPDGTVKELPAGQEHQIKSNQIGIHRFEGGLTSWESDESTGKLDFSLSSGAAWEKCLKESGQKDKFGKRLFQSITGQLVGVPMGLHIRSGESIFSGTNLAANVSTWDITGLKSMVNFHARGNDLIDDPGYGSWDVSEVEDFTTAFYVYFGKYVPNEWSAPNAKNWKELYSLSKVEGPITWTATLDIKKTGFNAEVAMRRMFKGCSELIGPVHMPMMFDVEERYNFSTYQMFADCTKMQFAPIITNRPEDDGNGNSYNAKFLRDCTEMFLNCHEMDGRPFREWQVTEELLLTERMFKNCHVFDADLSAWDMSSVTTANGMFDGCYLFSADLADWYTGSMQKMNYMFNECRVFNSDLGGWRVTRANAMTGMFKGCVEFDQDLSPWCVGEIDVKPPQFDEGALFEGQSLRQPDWGQCPPVLGQFKLTSSHSAGAKVFIKNHEDVYFYDRDGSETLIPGTTGGVERQIILSGDGDYAIDPMINVYSLRFENKSNNQPGLIFSDEFDVSNVKDFTHCFAGMAGMLDDANISGWDTSNATSFKGMFRNCPNMHFWENGLPASLVNGRGFQSHTNCDIGSWNTSNVTDMQLMFMDNRHTGKRSLSVRKYTPAWRWDTSKVTDMRAMFQRWQGKWLHDIGSWDVSNVKHFGWMFEACLWQTNAEQGFDEDVVPSNWQYVKLDRWNVIEGENFTEMFQGLNNQQNTMNNYATIGVGPWRTEKATNMVAMFNLAWNRDNLSDWCVPKINSRPNKFADAGGNQNGNLGGQPKWGSCDVRLVAGGIIAAYGSESRNIVQVGGEVDRVKDAETAPPPAWGIASQIWQIGDSPDPDDTSWTDIAGETTDTLVIDPAYDGKYVRLMQSSELWVNVTLNYPTEISLYNYPKPFGTLCTTTETGKQVWSSLMNQWVPPNQGSWGEYENYVGGPTQFDAPSNPIKVQPVPVGNVIVVAAWRSPTGGESLNIYGTKTTDGKVYYEDGTEFEIEAGVPFAFKDLSSGVYVIESDDLTALSFEGTKSSFSIDEAISYMDAITDASVMFKGCDWFSQDLSWWDTSSVTNMYGMFHNAVRFDAPVDSWNTTNVTNMSSTFEGAENFSNPVASWDISNVTDMSRMFAYTPRFTDDLNDWDVANVTNMASMFEHCSTFDQSLKKWNVSAVTNMNSMFKCAYLYDQDMYFWEPDACSDMDSMFEQASSLDHDISSWCVPLITKTPDKFVEGALFETKLELHPDWGWCAPTDQRGLLSWEAGDGLSFRGYIVEAGEVYDETTGGDDFRQTIGPGDFEVVLKTRLGHPYGLYSLPVGKFKKLNFMRDSTDENGAKFDFTNNFETPLCTDMSHFLEGHYAFDGQIDNLTTGHVTNMHRFFAKMGEVNLGQVQAKDLDTRSCKDMSEMFYECRRIDGGYGDLQNWDTSRVENMAKMFSGFGVSTTTLGCEGWDTSRVRNMHYMFSSTKTNGAGLNMDLGFWDTSNCTDMASMFRSSHFDYTFNSWQVQNVLNMDHMFLYSDYESNISDWCVPKIPSLPTQFGHTKPGLTPIWGTCPVLHQPPLIRIKDRDPGKEYSPNAEPGNEIIEWEADGFLTRPDGHQVLDSTWEIRDSTGPDVWVTIPSEDIIMPEEDDYVGAGEYQTKELNVSKAVRLKQNLFNVDTLAPYEIISNVIEISDVLPQLIGILRLKVTNAGDSDSKIYLQGLVDEQVKTSTYDSSGEIIDTEYNDPKICAQPHTLTTDGIVDIPTANFRSISFGRIREARIEIDPRSDLSFMVSMVSMFENVAMRKITPGSLALLDTSKVMSMKNCFSRANFGSRAAGVKEDFDVSGWDLSNVTDMEGAFEAIAGPAPGSGKTLMELKGMENWNTVNVKNMSSLFSVTANKQQTDPTLCFNFNIDRWNFSSVENATSMFGYQGNVFHDGNWADNASTVNSYLFLTYPNIKKKNWASLTNGHSLFANFRKDATHMDTANFPSLVRAERMFLDNYELTVNLNKWDTPNLNVVFEMFKNCYKVEGNFSGWCQNLEYADSSTTWQNKVFPGGPMSAATSYQNSGCPGEINTSLYVRQFLPKTKTCAKTDITSPGEIV